MAPEKSSVYSLRITQEAVDVFLRDNEHRRVNEGTNPHADYIFNMRQRAIGLNEGLKHFLDDSFVKQDDGKTDILRQHMRMGLVMACELYRIQREIEDLEEAGKKWDACLHDYSI